MTVKIVERPFVLGPANIEDLLRFLLKGWRNKRAAKAVEVALAKTRVITWESGGPYISISVNGEEVSNLSEEEAVGWLLQHTADEGFFKTDGATRAAEELAGVLTGASPSEAYFNSEDVQTDPSVQEFTGDVVRLVWSYATTADSGVMLNSSAAEFIQLLRNEGKVAAANTVAALLNSYHIGPSNTLATICDKLAHDAGAGECSTGRAATAAALEAGRTAECNGKGPGSAHPGGKKAKRE